jgi:hypothetical protein
MNQLEMMQTSIDDLKGEEFSPAEGNGVVQLVGAPGGWMGSS